MSNEWKNSLEHNKSWWWNTWPFSVILFVFLLCEWCCLSYLQIWIIQFTFWSSSVWFGNMWLFLQKCVQQQHWSTVRWNWFVWCSIRYVCLAVIDCGRIGKSQLYCFLFVKMWFYTFQPSWSPRYSLAYGIFYISCGLRARSKSLFLESDIFLSYRISQGRD